MGSEQTVEAFGHAVCLRASPHATAAVAESSRRQGEGAHEHPAEVALRSETTALGDGADGEVGGCEQLLGTLQAQAREHAHRGLASGLGEDVVEPRRREVAHRCQLVAVQ